MMYPSVITAWEKSIEERKAVWSRVVYTKCRFEPTYGAIASTDGDNTSRTATLLVKCHEKPFKRGDKVMLDLHVSDTPPNTAFVVQIIKPIYFGNYPDHWEAELS